MKNRAHKLLTCIVLLGLMVVLPACKKPPVANAGPDQTVNGGVLVTLDGSASTDPDTFPQKPGPLAFSWVQTAGTTATLSGATTAKPTFTAPNVSETLTFEMTVTDNENFSTKDSVNITVTNVNVNQPPVANAGPDQTIKAGASVTLDGSASTDPGGGTLTYSWKQTSGTTITLSGASTAKPTFTAPNVSDTLVFELTVTDSQSLSSTATVKITVQSVAVLYIANEVGNNVTSYKDPAKVNGNIVPDTNLKGANTKLQTALDCVVTKEQTLIVANAGAPASVTSYKNASATNGNLKPDGIVQGAQTQLNVPTSLEINRDDDLLFVANLGPPNSILVYAGASTTVFNGNLAPTRTITSAALNAPFGIAFGANDELYVANRGAKNVLVFAHASTTNGTVSPDRTITSPSFAAANLIDVFIDSHDTLFVVDGTGSIYIFDNAATLNGAVNPDFTLKVSGAVGLTDIAVDANGTGYIVDQPNNAIYSYDNISTLNGTLNPDRTIKGSNTQLLGPFRIFLME